MLFNVPFSTLFKVRLLATDGIVLLDWISIMAIALLTVVASLNIVMHDTEDSLRSRQFLSFLIAMSVWAFSLYFLYEQVSEEFLETACVPASILIAHFFTVTRGKIVFWSFLQLWQSWLPLYSFVYGISYRIRIYRCVHRLFFWLLPFCRSAARSF